MQIKNRYAPGPNGGYPNHQHGEYERRHDQYPRTGPRSGGRPSRSQRKPASCSSRCSLFITMDIQIRQVNLRSGVLTVDLLHNIETNGSGKNCGEGERGRSLCRYPVRSTYPMFTCRVLYAPPEVERTLTVGREAILEDSLEGCLDAAASGTTVWT